MERSYWFTIRQLASVERLRGCAWARWRWLTVLFVLSCTACAPIPIHLYVPDAPDGRVVYSQCPMNRHLPEGIVFTCEGVPVTVRLGKNDGRDYVDVRLEIPEGKTAVLRTYAIKVDRHDSRPARESVFLKDIHFQRRLMILVALINC